MPLQLLFVSRVMDRTSTEIFLRANAHFTTLRPLWYHSSGLWGRWLGPEDSHFINHSGHCQRLLVAPPVYCVTLLWGVWLPAFHKTGLSARVHRPCRQSLHSAAEGNVLISRSDCTVSPPTVVMFTLSVQTQRSTRALPFLEVWSLFGYPNFISGEAGYLLPGVKLNDSRPPYVSRSKTKINRKFTEKCIACNKQLKPRPHSK